ncbi:FMN phosphatase YigB (HAD superfamily) [Anoxybacillus tepidamans]|uniref:FMN phosphatase YigB (HAD superfamily) n=1 Tax=Anoxybacteroides tepidamans TaxID=265948 RepID=A0A7W8INT6_9BACL|nr:MULTISPECIES: HAD family hydrolase [Anoxybacillus]MBB5323092.1 FMN phosphatase YigB (HAD superfamily) [Anoxybacillus tepidamans]MCZ0756916.1 HAD family hydrolase [Anoxybacillus sp. J5B_2022]
MKVIVFDLDGTLYEDTHHFDYYAKRIEEKLREEKRTFFRKDYEAVLFGTHPLKIGSVYDAEEDLILLLDGDGFVHSVYEWNGNKWSDDDVQTKYPERIAVDLDNMLSIGDLWWVPSALGRHYGLTNKETYAAFLETRTFMMSPHFTMERTAGLAELLTQLRQHLFLVLMTNSPRPDSEAILEKLGLSNVFHKKIFQAKKPVDTAKHLKTICLEVGVRYEEIMSIGDNWRNDIFPAKQLGCQTIYIDPHQIGTNESADVVVRNVGEWVNLLRNKYGVSKF